MEILNNYLPKDLINIVIGYAVDTQPYETILKELISYNKKYEHQLLVFITGFYGVENLWNKTFSWFYFVEKKWEKRRNQWKEEELNEWCQVCKQNLRRVYMKRHLKSAKHIKNKKTYDEEQAKSKRQKRIRNRLYK